MERDAKRERIFTQIRRARGRGPLSREAREVLLQGLSSPKVHIRPERGRLGDDVQERFDRYAGFAATQAVTTAKIGDASELPGAVAEYLRSKERELKAKIAPHPMLTGAPWKEAELEVQEGLSDANDEVGISVAFAAVAETGSLVFLSSKDNPVALCYYPPVHIVAVPASVVLGAFEDIWGLLREKYGSRQMPRSTLFISGTSSTGDVGQILVRGSSGPLAVHVILVNDA